MTCDIISHDITVTYYCFWITFNSICQIINTLTLTLTKYKNWTVNSWFNIMLYLVYLTVMCCHHDVTNEIQYILSDWRFPEDHAQQCVGSNLSEEEDGLWQLFLTLPLLFLTRQRSVLLLIIKKTVKEVLVLKTQLLVHWGADEHTQVKNKNVQA